MGSRNPPSDFALEALGASAKVAGTTTTLQGRPIVWERRFARWLFVGVPSFLVLAIGGVFPWAEWAALAALTAGVLSHLVARARGAREAVVSPFALGGLVALAFAAVSALPLPLGLLDVVAPLSGGVQHDLAKVSGVQHAWVPFSLDAVASLRMARIIALFTLIFLLGVPLGRKPDTLRRVLRAFGMLGTGFVGIAVLNAVADDGAILGLYQPSTRLQPWTATLVNPNHSAALLGLTLPVTAALFATTRGVRGLTVWGGSALAQLALLLLTPSGNALVTPVFLAVVAGVFLVRRRRADSTRQRKVRSARSAILLGLGFLVAVLVVQTAFEPLRDVVSDAARFSKLPVILAGFELVPRAPLLGIGPGAFLYAFGAFGPAVPVALTAPESLPLQALLDFGAPLGLALLALGAFGLWRIARRAHADVLLMGLAAALVGFAVHDLADFAIDLPATGVLFFGFFGLAVGATDDAGGRFALRRVRVRTVAVLLALVAVTGAVAAYVGETVLPRRALVAWEPATKGPAPVPLEDAVAAGRFFPLDGRVWTRVGVATKAAGDTTRGLAWLDYAVRVMPQSPRANEALLAAVSDVDPERHEALLKRFVARFRTYLRRIDFAAGQVLRSPRLRERPRSILGDSVDVVARYVHRVVTRPLDVQKPALAGLIQDYGANLDVLLLLDKPLADAQLEPLRARWLATLFSEHDRAPQTWYQLAEDARRKGHADRAYSHLVHARGLATTPQPDLDARLVEVCLALDRVDEAARLLAETDGLAHVAEVPRTLLKARLAVAQGHADRALALLDHVLVDRPTAVDVLAVRATTLERLGRWHDAREAYEHLWRLTNKKHYRVRADQLQKKLTPNR